MANFMQTSRRTLCKTLNIMAKPCGKLHSKALWQNFMAEFYGKTPWQRFVANFVHGFMQNSMQ